MQIPNGDSSGRISQHDQGKSGIAPNGNSANGSQRARGTHGQSPVGHTTDSQIANLQTQLQDQQLRPEVVAAAQQELASGSLLTRQAAEQTAQSVAGIIKHF